jgi:hypothetical protein
MFKIGRKKQMMPFVKLFREISPKEFVAIFNSERAQTKAFILSFSPRKSYVRKVLHILSAKESNEDGLTSTPSFIIREYLKQRRKLNFGMSFVRAVEKEVENMIAEYVKQERDFF